MAKITQEQEQYICFMLVRTMSWYIRPVYCAWWVSILYYHLLDKKKTDFDQFGRVRFVLYFLCTRDNVQIQKLSIKPFKIRENHFKWCSKDNYCKLRVKTSYFKHKLNLDIMAVQSSSIFFWHYSSFITRSFS